MLKHCRSSLLMVCNSSVILSYLRFVFMTNLLSIAQSVYFVTIEGTTRVPYSHANPHNVSHSSLPLP